MTSPITPLLRLAPLLVLFLGLGVAPSSSGASASGVHAVSHSRDVAARRTTASGRCGPLAAARTSRAADTDSFSQARLVALQRDLQQRLRRIGVTRSTLATARSGPVIHVPVHVHVVETRRGNGPTRHQIDRQLRVVNGAYDGGQSTENTPTHFSFYLASMDRRVNATWARSGPNSAAQDRMRRTLHRGGLQDLNLYLTRPRSPQAGSTLLGFSTLAWQARHHRRLDGVTVNSGSVPGGSIDRFNRGDTTVHEIGHWLGLLHTFEGGCTEPNDGVADTPEEAGPSTGCLSVDTCPAPGTDPIHNFMDYSPDSCMNQFTPGQVTRMTQEWLAYRRP